MDLEPDPNQATSRPTGVTPKPWHPGTFFMLPGQGVADLPGSVWLPPKARRPLVR